MSRRRSLHASAAVAVAGAVLAWSAPAAWSATTLFTGRFVCKDRGEELPLAGARVELSGAPQSGFSFFGNDSFFSRVAVSHTGVDGEWSFQVRRRGENDPRYNFYVEATLDDDAGTMVSDWPNGYPVSARTDTNQNDVAVQDYHTLPLTGGECAVWLALRRAREDYGRSTGRPAPFGGVHAQYGDPPTLGSPYTAYDTILWPQDYPPGPGPGSQVAAIHEFGHLVRNSSLGSRLSFLNEVSQFDYRRRRNPCARTSPRFAFHEGWAEFWAGDFLPAPCPATETDPAVEGDVAWTLTRMEPSCGRRRMVAALLDRGRSIHSLGDFQRGLGSCVAVPLDPGTVPRSPISSPVRAGRWIADVRKALRAARGAAARLRGQVSAVRRAAQHARCLRPPCLDALERRVGPAIVGGRLAQAQLLASTLAAQLSSRSRRLATGKPTRASLTRLLTTPTVLTRGLARIGVRSLDAALATTRSITGRDHGTPTQDVVRALRSMRAAFLRAGRRGVGLPLSFGIAGARTPTAPSTSTKRHIGFDGLPDGTLITTETESQGAVFGSPAHLGFGAPAPRFVCASGPTAQGGAAVAARCPSDTEGLANTGAMARLTAPARSISVQVGATLSQPGGFDAVIKGYDAVGQEVAANAELVASTAFGDPRTGPVHQLKLQAAQGAPPIAFLALYFDGSGNSGARFVFDDLDYTG